MWTTYWPYSIYIYIYTCMASSAWSPSNPFSVLLPLSQRVLLFACCWVVEFCWGFGLGFCSALLSCFIYLVVSFHMTQPDVFPICFACLWHHMFSALVCFSFLLLCCTYGFVEECFCVWGMSCHSIHCLVDSYCLSCSDGSMQCVDKHASQCWSDSGFCPRQSCSGERYKDKTSKTFVLILRYELNSSMIKINVFEAKPKD